MPYRLAIVTIAASLLTGCSSDQLIDPNTVPGLVETITADATGPLHPPPVQFIATWPAEQGSSATCGQIAPPPSLDDETGQLRFIYFASPRFGQVEKHDHWISGSAEADAILAENRRLFNELWDRRCRSAEPFRESIRSWTGI